MLRAKDLGLTPTLNSSLEFNQSFPRLSRKFKAAPKVQLSKGLLNPEMMDSISFSTQATINSFHTDLHSNIVEDSINQSYYEQDVSMNPNPYKGVLTIDIKTSQVFLLNLHFWNKNVVILLCIIISDHHNQYYCIKNVGLLGRRIATDQI